jgi:hypothetical protein
MRHVRLTGIPSARDACEHGYSTFQQNVPSLMEMSREYDAVVVGSNPQGVNACAKHGKTR